MKYSIVDIGSNTIRLQIYEVDENGNIDSLMNKKTFAGLSSYVENGLMTKKGADKLVNILNNFIYISNHFKIENLHLFATAALRNATNREQILSYVEDQVGHKIDLLSGKEEARLGYLGIQEDYNISNGYIVDIGGGSVEISLVENNKVVYATSLTNGALSYYKEYSSGIFPKKKEALAIKKAIIADLEREGVKRFKKSLPIYGLGGTIRACGNISQEYFDLPSNRHLYKDSIRTLKKELQDTKAPLIKTVLQVVPERIHTIGPGAIVLYEIFRYLNASELYISKNGVREGYLKDKVSKN
ncbi:MAG: phosphatase [Bacillota bacterium]|nr:phosphatase [Bacillota bacterium]